MPIRPPGGFYQGVRVVEAVRVCQIDQAVVVVVEPVLASRYGIRRKLVAVGGGSVVVDPVVAVGGRRRRRI